MARRMLQPRFANARSVRNALERARLRQAARLVADTGRKLRKSDLMRIEAGTSNGNGDGAVAPAT